MSEATAKSFPSLKAYQTDKTGNGPKITAFLLLENWEIELQACKRSSLNGQAFETVLAKIQEEQLTFRQFLTVEAMSLDTAYGKQQIVEMNYRKLLHIADLLSEASDNANTGVVVTSTLNETLSLITRLFHFIEEFFGGFLDADRLAPAFFVRQIEGEVFAKLEQVKPLCMYSADHAFSIVGGFLSTLFTKVETPTVRELLYAKKLVVEITAPNVVTNAHRLRDRLYFMNFNEENFVMAEFGRLAKISEAGTDKSTKVSALRFEQKRINQLPLMYQEGWTQAMPPLHEQMNGWISEEIRFIESDSHLQSAPTNVAENSEKIQTSLSVAKLAVIIRLLVIDKIIINRNVAPMLRVVAKLFTTLQRDEISVGSLETKYHAPDKVTVAAVRDMLFKWINILGKL